MSSWLRIDATLQGTFASLLNEDTPQGTEGGSPFIKYGRNCWYLNSNLRDREDEDCGEIRDWFADLCARSKPQSADLTIEGYQFCYVFKWDVDRQRLELQLPLLYIEHLQAELAKFKEAPRNGWDGSYELFRIPPGSEVFYKEGE